MILVLIIIGCLFSISILSGFGWYVWYSEDAKRKALEASIKENERIYFESSLKLKTYTNKINNARDELKQAQESLVKAKDSGNKLNELQAIKDIEDSKILLELNKKLQKQAKDNKDKANELLIIDIELVKEAEQNEPSSGYIKHIGKDVRASDILCDDSGVSIDICSSRCDNDKDCIGYNYILPGGAWKEKSGCCTKNNDRKGQLHNASGIDFYMKKKPSLPSVLSINPSSMMKKPGKTPGNTPFSINPSSMMKKPGKTPFLTSLFEKKPTGGPGGPGGTRSKEWNREGFIQYTTDGTDLPRQPIMGSLSECKTKCEDSGECIGFSRSKSASSLDNCWLKKKFPSKTYNDKSYETYTLS